MFPDLFVNVFVVSALMNPSLFAVITVWALASVKYLLVGDPSSCTSSVSRTTTPDWLFTVVTDTPLTLAGVMFIVTKLGSSVTVIAKF